MSEEENNNDLYFQSVSLLSQSLGDVELTLQKILANKTTVMSEPIGTSMFSFSKIMFLARFEIAEKLTKGFVHKKELIYPLLKACVCGTPIEAIRLLLKWGLDLKAGTFQGSKKSSLLN